MYVHIEASIAGVVCYQDLYIPEKKLWTTSFGHSSYDSTAHGVEEASIAWNSIPMCMTLTTALEYTHLKRTYSQFMQLIETSPVNVNQKNTI